jgi:hypothetical protein
MGMRQHRPLPPAYRRRRCSRTWGCAKLVEIMIHSRVRSDHSAQMDRILLESEQFPVILPSAFC